MNEKQIAKNIKKIRLDRKMSQERLADLSGLTKGYISKIEKSDTAPPLSTLSKIAHSLNVDITVLTAEELEPPEDSSLFPAVSSSGDFFSGGLASFSGCWPCIC